MDNLIYDPWRIANSLELVSFEQAGHKYQALVELSDQGYRELGNITVEFFSHELQNVDTSSPSSLKTFCEKFGLIFSPMYPSKIYALQDRDKKNSILSSLSSFFNSGSGNHDSDNAIDRSVYRFKNPLRAENQTIPNHRSDGGIPVDKLFNTEYAHKTFEGTKGYGAIVGIDELALTIRQLQVSTAIISAYEANLNPDEMVDYLFRSSVLQHNLPSCINKDVFYGLVFDNPPCTSQEVYKRKKLSSPDDAKYFSHLHEIYLSMKFDELYTAATTFIKKSSTSLQMQNEGIVLGDSPEKSKVFSWGENHSIKEGSLLEAILANFEYVRVSKHDWHQCKYKGCRRVFKFHKEYDPSKRFRQAEYCKQSCRVMDATSQS